VHRWLAAFVASAALAAGATGCGLGPGAGASNVTLTVTRDFGSRPLHTVSQSRVPGAETVMRLLQRRFTVTTRYGGGFVQSINGAAGDGSQHDWFFYVNGIEAGQGAAATAINRGDRIWWDLHDWSQTQSVPAVVGSFPEPFVHGIKGKRYPTVVECAAGEQAVCGGVATALHAYGVKAPEQLLGTGSGTDSLGILVGTWSQLEPLVAARLIAKGPASGGVYAHFAGGRLQLLDARGRIARSLGAGAGLVAATRDAVAQPVWVVTGTDPAGVRAAAAAITPARLHDHFALAVQGGHDFPVPLAPTS
jgi:hypothetical protein